MPPRARLQAALYHLVSLVDMGRQVYDLPSSDPQNSEVMQPPAQQSAALSVRPQAGPTIPDQLQGLDVRDRVKPLEVVDAGGRHGPHEDTEQHGPPADRVHGARAERRGSGSQVMHLRQHGHAGRINKEPFIGQAEDAAGQLARGTQARDLPGTSLSVLSVKLTSR